MLAANNIAFKEWGVVCAALAAGRQTIILRKGGIDEGSEGFRVGHQEFWLLPTRFHQDVSQLKPEATTLWPQGTPPATDRYLVDLYAVVEKVFHLHDLRAVERLDHEHILSRELIEQRFHYRRPGLFVLAARIYRVPVAFELSDSPYIAGCKSWVELPKALSTAGAAAVMDEVGFQARVRTIESAINAAS